MQYKVPILNRFYMLSYVWGLARHGDLARYRAEDDFSGVDILADWLLMDFARLRRAGFWREYRTRHEEISGVRGKIGFTASLARRSFENARAVCEFDEFTEDNAINQAIKAAVRRLWRTRGVDADLKRRLAEALRLMSGIDDVALESVRFDFRLNRNNHYNYYHILKVCELVRDSTMPSEGRGEYQFIDPINSDRQLWEIFERFVYEFYKAKLGRSYEVGRQKELRWGVADPNNLMPVMRTDTTIFGPRGENIIIDTKFYQNYLADGPHGQRRLNTGNLYQMYAYLNHFKASERLTGILLYPRPYDSPSASERYSMPVQNGGRVTEAELRIETVDLGQEWRQIEADLMQIIGVKA